MILVTGATGFIGRHLVKKLADSEHRIRIIGLNRRRMERLGWHEHPCIEIVDGSIFKPEDLHRAMLGVHTVFHLASAQWWGRFNDLERIDVGGTRNIITAGRSARIGRIIVLSHPGAEPSSAFNLLNIKGKVEEAVRTSGIAYTILRCGVIFGPEDRFVNNIAMLLRLNPFFTFQPGAAEALLSPLHIDDLVTVLEKSLEVIDLVDNTVEIGGAEYITYNEMLRTVMRVSRARRTIIAVPPFLLRGITSFMKIFIPRWPMTAQWFDMLAGHRTPELSNIYNYTGVRPRRFEDTLVMYMPQRRYFFELLRYLLRRAPRSVF